MDKSPDTSPQGTGITLCPGVSAVTMKKPSSALSAPSDSSPELSCLVYLEHNERSRFLAVKNKHDIYAESAAEMFRAIENCDWQSPVFKTLKAYDTLFYLYANGHIREETFVDVHIGWLQLLTQFDKEAEIPAISQVKKIPCRKIIRIPYNQLKHLIPTEYDEKKYGKSWRRFKHFEKAWIESMPEKQKWFTVVGIEKADNFACYLTDDKYQLATSCETASKQESLTDKNNTRFTPCEKDAPCENEMASWCHTFNKRLPTFRIAQCREPVISLIFPSCHILKNLRSRSCKKTDQGQCEAFFCYGMPDLKQYIRLHRNLYHPVALNHPEVKNNLLVPDGIKAGWFAAAYHDLAHLQVMAPVSTEHWHASLDFYDCVQNIKQCLEDADKQKLLFELIRSVYLEMLTLGYFQDGDQLYIYPGNNTGFINNTLKKWVFTLHLSDFQSLIEVELSLSDPAKSLGDTIFCMENETDSDIMQYFNTIAMLALLDEETQINPYFLSGSVRDKEVYDPGTYRQQVYDLVKKQKKQLGFNPGEWLKTAPEQTSPSKGQQSSNLAPQ